LYAKVSVSYSPHVRKGRISGCRQENTIEFEQEVGYEKLIVHVSAMFTHPVFEK